MLGQRCHSDKPVLHFPHLGTSSAVAHCLWWFAQQEIRQMVLRSSYYAFLWRILIYLRSLTRDFVQQTIHARLFQSILSRFNSQSCSCHFSHYLHIVFSCSCCTYRSFYGRAVHTTENCTLKRTHDLQIIHCIIKQEGAMWSLNIKSNKIFEKVRTCA